MAKKKGKAAKVCNTKGCCNSSTQSAVLLICAALLYALGIYTLITGILIQIGGKYILGWAFIKYVLAMIAFMIAKGCAKKGMKCAKF